MESYNPTTAKGFQTFHLALFRGVRNAGALRERLIGAASMVGEAGELERERVAYGFVDAKMVSTMQSDHWGRSADGENRLRARCIC